MSALVVGNCGSAAICCVGWGAEARPAAGGGGMSPYDTGCTGGRPLTLGAGGMSPRAGGAPPVTSGGVGISARAAVGVGSGARGDKVGGAIKGVRDPAADGR